MDSNENPVPIQEQNDGNPQVQRSTQADVLAAAARLLVVIAGPEPVHIEMSPRGPKKYYDVHRPLTERDTRAHLQGWKTKGASLRYPDGMTRALCYDADIPEDWQHLVEAAQLLPYGDYLPLLVLQRDFLGYTERKSVRGGEPRCLVYLMSLPTSRLLWVNWR